MIPPLREASDMMTNNQRYQLELPITFGRTINRPIDQRDEVAPERASLVHGLTVGRQPMPGQVVLDHPNVSRRHAIFEVADGAFVLRDLGSFLEATDWKLIWGLNLGRGTIEAAVDEAKAVLAATGANLFAFEIGNEPDLFPNREIHRKKAYDYADYLLEYRKFRDALRKSIPGIPFAGPDVATATSWVSRFSRDEG